MMADQDNANNVRIVGIICPIAWDKQGKAIDVIIAADGEKEFFFCDSPKKQILLCLSGFKIELICSLDTENQKYIFDIDKITFL